MDLLLSIVGAGVATAVLIGVIARVAGGRPVPRLDRAQAVRRLTEDWQDFTVGTVLLATDGAAALATDAGGGPRLGLVYRLGDRFPTRLIAPGEVIGVALSGGGLAFTLCDVGRDHFALQVDGTADDWADRLKALGTVEREQ